MSARHWLLAAWLAAVPAWATDTVAPALPGQRPAPGSDEDELWYAMDRAERELRQHPRRVTDPALNAYVQAVACRVAGGHCADLRVYLVDQPWFNASMAPNGMMVVWTGALLRCQDEAELALVLAHEVAHYRQRHSLQQWRKAKDTSAIAGSLGLLALGGGAGPAGYLADVLGAAGLSRFSREAEREADQLGFSAAVAQGYAPAAGARLWQRLKAEEDARRGGKPLPVFASHPRTAERLADVQAAAQSLGTGGDDGREAYRLAVRPFVADWLEAELSRRQYDSSVRVISDLRALADAGLDATYAFFLGEAFRRRGRDGDAVRAQALYEEAVALPDPPAAAFREHAMALRSQGNRAGASEAFQQYLVRSPDAEDVAFVRQYLVELEASP